MFVTAGQRIARARDRFGLSPGAPAVMTSPAGGFVEATHPRPGDPRIRQRLLAGLGLDPFRALTLKASALAVDGERVVVGPLNHANTDFADPIELRRTDVALRWWDVGGGANVTCRLWLTTADGRWALQDVPRKALFLRSKFAVGLDDLIAALGGVRVDPAPDAEL